ncbi:MAG: hypothetical protein H6700_00775 [Myxococcales bacterium]|nr:hypothetical protein [Myxococcales bacterium]
MVRSSVRSVAAWSGLIFAAALSAACPSSGGPDGIEPAPAEPAAAEASGAAEAEEPGAPAEAPSEPAAVAEGSQPPPAGNAVCPFEAAEAPVGAVKCPDGCAMIRGAMVDEGRGCALTGPAAEVALACLRLPLDIEDGGRCYVDAEGHHVVTALGYPALATAAWRTCEADYPFRAVPPCPDAAEGSAGSDAAGGGGEAGR